MSATDRRGGLCPLRPAGAAGAPSSYCTTFFPGAWRCSAGHAITVAPPHNPLWGPLMQPLRRGLSINNRRLSRSRLIAIAVIGLVVRAFQQQPRQPPGRAEAKHGSPLTVSPRPGRRSTASGSSWPGPRYPPGLDEETRAKLKERRSRVLRRRLPPCDAHLRRPGPWRGCHSIGVLSTGPDRK